MTAFTMERYLVRKTPVVNIEDRPVSKKAVNRSRRKRAADEKFVSKKIKRQPSIEELPVLKAETEILWTMKYKPNSLQDMIGSYDQFAAIKRWIKDWKFGEEEYWNNDALLIIGPPGIGKTSLVYAIAHELQFKIFEVNCGLARKIVSTTEKLRETIQTHQVCRNDTPKLTKLWASPQTDLYDRDDLTEISLSSNSIILFDDIDFMVSDGVNGFWSTLKSLVQESKKPIILTATRYSDYIETLIHPLKIFQLEPPQPKDIIEHLNGIMAKEQIENHVIELSSVSCFNGDVRRTLNEYQYNHKNFINTKAPMELTICEDPPPRKLQYDLLCLSDIIASKAGILSPDETRNNFIKGKDIPFDGTLDLRTTAIDLIDSIQILADNVFGEKLKIAKKQDLNFKNFNAKLNDCFKKFNRSMSNETIALEFFPYLSLINTFQSSRRYQTRGTKTAKVPIVSMDPFLIRCPAIE